jgi:hypothetical protein
MPVYFNLTDGKEHGRFLGSPMTHLRHAKLTYELRGLIFEVRKKLKTGWPEEVYHQGLVQLLHDLSYLPRPTTNRNHRKNVRVLFRP